MKDQHKDFPSEVGYYILAAYNNDPPPELHIGSLSRVDRSGDLVSSGVVRLVMAWKERRPFLDLYPSDGSALAQAFVALEWIRKEQATTALMYG